jgi:acyl-CoA ligase (AMP-forming) (exosortase A-associated)
MMTPYLLHHLIERQAALAGSATALTLRGETLTYAELDRRQQAFAAGLAASGIQRAERVAIYLSKSFELVVAAFGASRAGLVFVPVNPLLKPNQLAHILRDCDVRVLVTSPERHAGLAGMLREIAGLRLVILTAGGAAAPHRNAPHGGAQGGAPEGCVQGRVPEGRAPEGGAPEGCVQGCVPEGRASDGGALGGRMPNGRMPDGRTSEWRASDRRASDGGPATCGWAEIQSAATAPAAPAPAPLATDQDMAAIFYTSGSTGMPKGVVISHRNLVSGAASVASYLENRPADRLLAALPLSFDAGFSQLTTAFTVGASVVLLDYLLPAEVLRVLAKEQITGLTAVPALWIQLAALDWPAAVGRHLRYFANTGGRMPVPVLQALRARVPAAKPYLMYGLTEAFRSTYLPPEEVDRRPDSIGKAIPNQEILILRPDGTPCEADEPGELVHRGSTVALGYWGDSARTAERFRPLPGAPAGLQLTETVVFSGDKARRDREGFLYFIGREDEMIKSSGYRISPTEVEEAAYASGLVAEVVAFAIEDPQLGQAVAVVVVPQSGQTDARTALLDYCRKILPPFMVPRAVFFHPGPMPRNPNGKLDRKRVSREAVATSEPADELLVHA